jgi:hypothetical protein
MKLTTHLSLAPEVKNDGAVISSSHKQDEPTFICNVLAVQILALLSPSVAVRSDASRDGRYVCH